MAGGGTKTTSTTSSGPNVPPEIEALMRYVLPDIETAYGQQPLSGFLGPQPSAVADLNPAEMDVLGAQYSRAFEPALNPLQQLAGGTYADLAATPRGPLTAEEQDALGGLRESIARRGPANQEEVSGLEGLRSIIASPTGGAEGPAMDAIRTLFGQQSEIVKNQAALAGLGRSGAVGYGLGQLGAGLDQAMVPIILAGQQNRLSASGQVLGAGEAEEQRRQTAIRDLLAAGHVEAARSLAAESTGAGGLAGLGGTQEEQTVARLGQAFSAADIPRQQQQAHMGETLQDYLRRQGIIGGISSAVTGFAPATFGQQGFQVNRSTGGGGSGIPVSLGVNLGSSGGGGGAK